MKKFEVRISTCHSMDDFHKRSVKFYATKNNIDVTKLSHSELFELHDILTNELLQNFSDTSFDTYQELKYENRCSVLEKAFSNEKKFITNLLNSKFKSEVNKDGIHLIEISHFEDFIETLSDSCAIDWKRISEDQNIEWNVKIIDKGKFVWDWTILQLNHAAIPIFDNFQNIEKFQSYLDWRIVSCDNRLVWDIEQVKKFKNNIEFSIVFDENIHLKKGPTLSTCFINNGAPAGLSMNPHLREDIIIEFLELWDWRLLSSNPAILRCDIFNLPISKFLNLWGFSRNTALTLSILQELRNFYFTPDSEKCPKIDNMFWAETLSNTSINWDINNIVEFLDILEEYGNWKGISRQISDKELILKYCEKLDFINLTLNSKSNKEIIWDSELIEVLIKSFKGKELVKYSSQWGYKSHNMDRAGFPGILSHIKITKDAIIKNKEFWRNTYLEHFIRTAIKDENKTYVDELWDCLKENKNIIWDDDLNEAYYNQKYKVDDLITIVSTGVTGLVIATKVRPLFFTQSGNQSKAYPKNEYLVCLKKNSRSEEYTFEGIVDINENDIQQLI